MNVARWNKKRLGFIAISLIILYFVFSAKYYTYQVDTVIHDSQPEDVWEYVADFSKMKMLNPLIYEFRILADHGENLQHWKYSVEYKEKLAHWPYTVNLNHGDFVVRKMPAEEGNYTVESEHRTCFLLGLYCLYSNGNFKFSTLIQKDSTNTYVIESITYQCPPLLSSICRREVEYQHKKIMENLTKHFLKNKRKN